MFWLWTTLGTILMSGSAMTWSAPWSIEPNYWRRTNLQEVIKNMVEQNGAAWKVENDFDDDDDEEWTQRIIKKKEMTSGTKNR